MNNFIDINIRNGSANDCYDIYKLQISSIKYFCNLDYDENTLKSWVASKSPELYKNMPDHQKLIVAVRKNKIIGFGILNIRNKTIESLYILPSYEKRGVGKEILKRLESVAVINGLSELTLSSTLNATKFYHHMGYIGEMISDHTLPSGLKLKCVKMKKNLV